MCRAIVNTALVRRFSRQAGQAPRRASPGRRELLVMTDAWVYLLRCRDGSLYTGWTVDLERRLRRHRSGVASRYTASRLPVELALAIPMGDRTAARREEARIKRLSRPQKLALISSLTTPVQDATRVGGSGCA